MFGVAGLHKVSDPALRDATDAILDEFQEALFGSKGDDDAHHRITLFKRVRLQPVIMRDASGKQRWPGSGWLVPIARSGHVTKNTRTRFLCPDDTDNAQGVAGRAWARPTVVVEEVPDLTSANRSEKDVRLYANATYMPEEWVRKRCPGARSLMGFRVDDATSEPWGVLVIDSRLTTFNTQIAQQEFSAYAPVLARLVQSM